MKKTLLIVFTCLATLGWAQKSFKGLPKISEADFVGEKSTISPDAPAEFLYRSVRNIIMTDGNIESTYIIRLKIFDKDKASEYLDAQFMLYETDQKDRERVQGFSAVTYNLVDGKIVTDKVEKDSRFRSKEDKNYMVTKFTFPNVKNGSIVEYKYTIAGPQVFLWSIDRFMVEIGLPQRYVEYFLDAPKFLGYNINYKGTLAPKIRQTDSQNIYGSEYNVYRFGYENVPAYKNENYVLNNDNYRTSVKAELNSTNISGEFKSYSLTWEDIRKRLYEHEDFGSQLKKTNLIKDLLPADIKTIPSKLDRADAVLKFVQKNYSWNKESSVATDEGLRNLITTKLGNSAEINLLLTMLMRSVDLNANPIVISTVDRGLLLDYSPTISQLNYVFTGLEEKDNFYYYAATSKIAKVYELPSRALNGNGYMISEKEAKSVNVYYPKMSQTFLDVNANLNSDGTFSGKFTDRDTNLYANFVNDSYLDSKDEHEKAYKDRYKFALTDIKSGLTEKGDFETSLNFSSDTFVDAIGSKLVFNPLLFLFSQNHNFDQTEPRKGPIQFTSANEKVKKVVITIPEGFVFENIPAPKKFRTDDDAIVYSYTPVLQGNKLSIETKITIADETFPAEYYPAFKQIFDNITKLEGQVVTAVKK